MWILAIAVAVASVEDAPPHQAAGDSTAECYTWAADGQCTSNPDYMLSSCRYSCHEWFAHRRKTYPDAPIDKQPDCHGWAKKGECKANAPYMKTECPESCKDKWGDDDEAPGEDVVVRR